MTAALDKSDIDAGLKAMATLSPAARVRKAFFTGRPTTLAQPVPPVQAIGILFDKLMKLITLQKSEKDLNPDDVAGYLVWAATDSDGLNKSFLKRLHGRSDTGTLLERVNSFSDSRILGLMFTQIDGEEIFAKVVPLSTAKEDQKLLMDARLNFLKQRKHSIEN